MTSPRTRREALLAAAFYVSLVALIIAVPIFPHVLPYWIARRIEHNSEGYVAALLLAGWIQFARPRVRRSALQWPTTLTVAILWVLVGVLLITLPVPEQFRMLHEAFFALAVLTPYVQLPRPLPVRFALAGSVMVLAAIAVGHRGRLITDLAESGGMLVLAAIGLDAVDRGILDPRARTSPRLRHLWYAALVILPIAISVLQWHIRDSGDLEVITRYASRVTEAFVFMLLVELYFAVGLGRAGTGRRYDISQPAAPTTSVDSRDALQRPGG